MPASRTSPSSINAAASAHANRMVFILDLNTQRHFTNVSCGTHLWWSVTPLRMSLTWEWQPGQRDAEPPSTARPPHYFICCLCGATGDYFWRCMHRPMMFQLQLRKLLWINVLLLTVKQKRFSTQIKNLYKSCIQPMTGSWNSIQFNSIKKWSWSWSWSEEHSELWTSFWLHSLPINTGWMWRCACVSECRTIVWHGGAGRGGGSTYLCSLYPDCFYWIDNICKITYIR